MGASGRVGLWQSLRLLAPIVAFVLPYPIARLSGGFAPGFQMVGQDLSPVEAFGILGTMLLPLAAWNYCTMKLEQTRAVLARSWPSVPGRIDTSDVLEKTAYRTGRYAALDVRYTYRVGGTDYAGERLAFAPRWQSDRYVIASLAKRYTAGATVDVRYDPDQPWESVLETDPQLARQRLSPVWLCLFTIAVCVVVLVAQRLLH